VNKVAVWLNGNELISINLLYDEPGCYWDGRPSVCLRASKTISLCNQVYPCQLSLAIPPCLSTCSVYQGMVGIVNRYR